MEFNLWPKNAISTFFKKNQGSSPYMCASLGCNNNVCEHIIRVAYDTIESQQLKEKEFGLLYAWGEFWLYLKRLQTCLRRVLTLLRVVILLSNDALYRGNLKRCFLSIWDIILIFPLPLCVKLVSLCFQMITCNPSCVIDNNEITGISSSCCCIKNSALFSQRMFKWIFIDAQWHSGWASSSMKFHSIFFFAMGRASVFPKMIILVISPTYNVHENMKYRVVNLDSQI
jgi:hypothetical protein